MWSWSSSPATSSEPTPSLEPDPSQVRSINGLSRASSQAGTQAKLSRYPSLNHAYRACSVLCSRLSQDEPSRHRPNPRAGPSPNKPEQNPEPRAEPRAEPRTEAEPNLQPSSESRGEPMERRTVKYQTDPRAEMPIRVSNKAEPSTEPRTWFDPVWSLSLAEPVFELRLTKLLARTSSA